LQTWRRLACNNCSSLSVLLSRNIMNTPHQSNRSDNSNTQYNAMPQTPLARPFFVVLFLTDLSKFNATQPFIDDEIGSVVLYGRRSLKIYRRIKPRRYLHRSLLPCRNLSVGQEPDPPKRQNWRAHLLMRRNFRQCRALHSRKNHSPIAIRHSLSFAFLTCRFADLTTCRKFDSAGASPSHHFSFGGFGRCSGPVGGR